MKINKKGQITIFVIIGIVIVISLVFAFVMLKQTTGKILPEENPQAYIEQCVEEGLAIDADFLIKNNFYPNRNYSYINYRGIFVPYLCTTSQFYTPCMNQEPMLVNYVENYLKNLTLPRANKCFDSLISALEKKGYVAQQSPMQMSMELENNAITININKKISTKLNEESKTYENFNINIQSPIYRMIDTVRNIINYESKLCEFNDIGWALHYRDIGIQRFSASDQTKVYTITDKNSNKKINFAVKTCPLPAGI